MIRRIVSIAFALSVLGAAGAGAQDGAWIGGLTIEVETRARWLHGGQKAELVAHNERRRWIRFDSVTASAAGGRAYAVNVSGSPERAGDAGRVETGPEGATTWAGVAEREPPAMPGVPDDLRRSLQLGRFVQNGEIVLPETALWELVPRTPPALRSGAGWSDTIRLGAERHGVRQEYTVERVSVVERDTLIGGIRLWIIADSASIEYLERRLELERSLDTLVVVERSGVGVTRGRHLYDPASGLFQLRHDTTTVTGAAVLSYPDGRRFATSARYERVRAWRMLDSMGLAARARQLEAERERTRLSGVRVPRNRVEERLHAGDSALADSLLSAWRRTSDASVRRDIETLLRLSADPDLRAGERIDSLRFEAGDTASAIERIRRTLFSRPLSLPDVRLLGRLQADPGLALAHGLERDGLYLGPAEALLRKPPAAVAEPRDWPCAPEACRAIARQWEDAREPRLRDLGLIAHFLMEPARWEGVITARAAEGSPLVRWALEAVEGRTAASTDAAAIPPRGAAWPAWRDWLGSRTQPTAQQVAALRFLEARTGRDVVTELRRGMARVTSDSATLIFGGLLLALDAHTPDPAAVAERVGSGSTALLQLARLELDALFGAAVDAEPETAEALADHALAIFLEAAPSWPRVEGLARERGPAGPAEPVMLLADNLPDAVAARWARRLPIVTAGEWAAMSSRRAASLVSLGYAKVMGPFAWIQVAQETRAARAADEAPQASASGVAWTLMHTRTGWVIVAESNWAT